MNQGCKAPWRKEGLHLVWIVLWLYIKMKQTQKHTTHSGTSTHPLQNFPQLWLCHLLPIKYLQVHFSRTSSNYELWIMICFIKWHYNSLSAKSGRKVVHSKNNSHLPVCIAQLKRYIYLSMKLYTQHKNGMAWCEPLHTMEQTWAEIIFLSPLHWQRQLKLLIAQWQSTVG